MGSQYGIFAHVWVTLQANADKYSMHGTSGIHHLTNHGDCLMKNDDFPTSYYSNRLHPFRLSLRHRKSQDSMWLGSCK